MKWLVTCFFVSSSFMFIFSVKENLISIESGRTVSILFSYFEFHLKHHRHCHYQFLLVPTFFCFLQ
jgi:hypothetical protein